MDYYLHCLAFKLLIVSSGHFTFHGRIHFTLCSRVRPIGGGSAFGFCFTEEKRGAAKGFRRWRQAAFEEGSLLYYYPFGACPVTGQERAQYRFSSLSARCPLLLPNSEENLCPWVLSLTDRLRGLHSERFPKMLDMIRRDKICKKPENFPQLDRRWLECSLGVRHWAEY